MAQHISVDFQQLHPRRMSTVSNIIIRHLRRDKRFSALMMVVFRSLWSYRRLSRHGEPTRQQRAEWLHAICTAGLAAMDIRFAVVGPTPTSGLIVSNHLSYLDILTLSAIVPCVFVSKAEVESWPIVGRFARWAGCVFVERRTKGDAARKNTRVAEALLDGVIVVLFPEGRTTDSHQISRFHSTMLQPAIDTSAFVTPCAITYQLDDGSVEKEVCYWGDMTLWPHSMNLLGKRGIRARIAFGRSMPASGGRRDLSHALHGHVGQLYADLRAELLQTTGLRRSASAVVRGHAEISSEKSASPHA